MPDLSTSILNAILTLSVILSIVAILIIIAPLIIWNYCKKIHDLMIEMYNSTYAIIKNQEKQLMQQQILINKLINK